MASRESKLVITNKRNRLSQQEIDRMVMEAEQFDDGGMLGDSVCARRGLQNYCFDCRRKLSLQHLPGGYESVIQAELDWLRSHPRASAKDFEARLKILKDIIEPPDSIPTGAGPAGQTNPGPLVEDLD